MSASFRSSPALALKGITVELGLDEIEVVGVSDCISQCQSSCQGELKATGQHGLTRVVEHGVLRVNSVRIRNR